MSKNSTEYSCVSCGYSTMQWLGKCPGCKEWNSLEQVQKSLIKNALKKTVSDLVTIDEIHYSEEDRFSTGIEELDRVVGGGLLKGSLTLLGGEPGIGKSTLILELCRYFPKKIVYVSGEESTNQIGRRCNRLGIRNKNLLMMQETVWENIKSMVLKEKPELFILDSIQTTVSSDISAVAGSPSQIKEIAFELMELCKANNITSITIGHITKEGTIAGPKLLEHMVDTALYFEGDKNQSQRYLRTMKNRFGSTSEVGLFRMSAKGLEEDVSNIEQITKRKVAPIGATTTCFYEGRRLAFCEIQGLIVEGRVGVGKRVSTGIDINRVSLMTAILDKYFEIPFSSYEIYLKIIGRDKLNGRDSDLAIIVTLLSSYKKRSVDTKSLFLGEVGLTGEILPINSLEEIIKEAKLFGYKRVYTALESNEHNKSDQEFQVIKTNHISELNLFE